jgi:hypothetical protein
VGAVTAALPQHVRLHVFGVARTTLLAHFAQLGVASIDSAAPVRQAWLSATDNYYTLGRAYAAIRVPIAEQERPKRGTLVARSAAPLHELRAAEWAALSALRAWDAGALGLRATVNTVLDYDRLLAGRVDGQTLERRRQLYRETLRDHPWRRCACAICRALGLDVMLFRGNNRNRRRGFHNLWVTYRQLDTLPSAR